MTDFDRWVEAFTAEWARQSPQLCTMQQYFSGAEQDALDRKLSLAGQFGVMYGLQAAKAAASLARRGLEELRKFASDDLSQEQRVSAAIVERRLGDAVGNEPFAQHRFVFNQIVGLHVGLVHFMTSTHPIRNERDAENYCARLSLIADCLDQGIAESKSAAAAGIVAPRFILERTIAQVEALAGGDPEQHTLVTSLGRQLADLDGIPPQRSEKFAAEARDVVRDSVIPAFDRVRDLLREQLATSTDVAGAWSLPSGAAYYAQQLAVFTGSTLAASEIHAIGLREVARIEDEMDAILRELGYAGGAIDERIARLNASRKLPSGSDARAAVLDQLQKIIDDAERRSREHFALRPRAAVTVEREPAFSERSAAAHYTPPAPDGTRPGIYWVPLAEVDTKVPWLGIGLKSTAYHEAIPGHHFQLAIQVEADGLPHFRKRGAFGFDSSYGEGWALYAERLAEENGWYDGDLPSRLGYLEMQLFRARRLVVDTGIHEMRWTREQAIDYGITPAEVERYIAWPGQACSYMLGQLRILELRERAKAALGKRFSIKDFHDVVLGGGTMPLGVLEQRVNAWIGDLVPAYNPA